MLHAVNIANHVYQQNKRDRRVQHSVCEKGEGRVCVASVVDSDVAEQVGHGLPVVGPPDGLSEDHADIHGFDFWTLKLLPLMRNGVGHHHLEAQYDSLSAQCHGDFGALTQGCQDPLRLLS